MGDKKRIEVGDTVSRISYRSDILFRVEKLLRIDNRDYALLRGLDVRLMADAPIEDLRFVSEEECRKKKERVLAQAREYLRRSPIRMRSRIFTISDTYKDNSFEYQSLPGRVLHLDGDQDYFAKCMDRYRDLNIEVEGAHVPEEEQPQVIERFLARVKPDLLVATGHDGVFKEKKDSLNLDDYYNSRYYVETVRKARVYEWNRDSLIIFAGACQSLYEELIKAGANYASSPDRVMIHAFDPLLVAKAIAFTSISEVIDPGRVIASTISGVKGIGGIETWGRFRLALPPIS